MSNSDDTDYGMDIDNESDSSEGKNWIKSSFTILFLWYVGFLIKIKIFNIFIIMKNLLMMNMIQVIFHLPGDHCRH